MVVTIGILLAMTLSGASPTARAVTPPTVARAPVASAASPSPSALPPIREGPNPASGGTSAWVNITPASGPSPPCGGDQALAYDPLLWEFVAFGGVIPCSGPGFAGGSTWTFSNGTWTNITASLPTAPAPRYGMAMAYDAADGYIVAFGGATSSGSAYGDTWTFNGTWNDITSSQTVSPPGVFNAGITYDPATGSVILLDGSTGSGNPNANGTWAFSGGLWAQVPATTLPPPLRSPGMFYDPLTSSILLYGGVGDGSNILDGTWSYADGNWTLLTPATSPPAVFDETAFFDGAGQRAILYGGYTLLPPAYSPVGGTWSFSNGNWTNISSSIVGSPLPLSSARAAWDPAQNWTMVFGGRTDQGLSDTTWAFPQSPVWALAPRLTTSATSVDLGHSINLTATPNGGTGPYTFVYTGLPPGCGSANSSTLACTPTENGTFPVMVNVTDSTDRSGSAEVSLVVNPALGLSLSVSATLVEPGQNVTFRATATGGAGGNVYEFQPTTPDCRQFVSTFVCDSSAPRTYNVSATVEDLLGVSADAGPITATVLAALTAQLSASDKIVDVGQSINVSVDALGGTGTYTVSYAGLPTGCATANLTTLSCAPDAPGNFSVVAHVQDTLGASALTAVLPIGVYPTLVASFVTPSPHLVVGTDFDMNATVSGGAPPLLLTWTGLPAGCDGVGEELRCLPTTPGTYSVHLSVLDRTGASVEANATVEVAAAPSQPSTSNSPSLFSDPLLWIALVVVGAAVVVGLVLLLRRRPPPPAPVSPVAATGPSGSSGATPTASSPDGSGWVVRGGPPPG